jgi:hypothetical protein
MMMLNIVRLQMGVEVTTLQRTVHLLQDTSSAAAKVREDQVAAKVIADARRHQENEDFKQVVALRNGRSVSVNVKGVIDLDGDDDEVAVVEGDNYDGLGSDGLDGSGLSGGKEHARLPCASSLGAQPSAHGLRGGDDARCVAKRVLLEQTTASSAPKKLDSNHWFYKGKEPKKAQHQDTQERMDNLMEEIMVEGGLMRQAIKDLTV